MKLQWQVTLAGLHCNSVKRLERAHRITGRDHAANLVGEALRRAGIITGTFPSPFVRKAIERY